MHSPTVGNSIVIILIELIEVAVAILCFTACAGKTTRFGSENEAVNEASQADGAAFVSDAIFLRKEMNIRPVDDLEFYFKHCSLGGQRHSHFSKTSYWCTEP